MVKLEVVSVCKMCYNPVFLESRSLVVDCGKCFECRQKVARNWSIRLSSELTTNPHSLFVTLTYDEEHYSTSTLDKRDAQLFIKRLRKRLKGRLIKYFLVGEYGTETMRKHFHAILFNVYINDLRDVYDSWQKGSVDVGAVQSKSIAYVTGYINKKIGDDCEEDFIDAGFQPAFRLMSKNLGTSFIFNNYDEFVLNKTFNYSGKTYPVPRYFRDKLGLITENPEFLSFITTKQIQKCIELSNRYGIPFNGDFVDFYSELSNTTYYDDKRIIAEMKNTKIRRDI